MALSAVIISVITVFQVVTGKDALQSTTLSVEKRIVGGNPIPISQAPYLATLELDTGEYMGTASLLSKDWAISAAHCTKRQSPYYLRVGSNTVGAGGSLHEVKQFVFYEKDDASTSNHDIVLIEVIQPFVFSNTVSTVQVKSANLLPGTEVVVSGFGWTEIANSTERLHQARSKIMDIQTCKTSYYAYYVKDWTVCIGVETKGKGSCFGDSGSPAVLESNFDSILIGIVYAGSHNCSNSHYFPGYYTNVVYFLNWIKSVIRI